MSISPPETTRWRRPWTIERMARSGTFGKGADAPPATIAVADPLP